MEQSFSKDAIEKASKIIIWNKRVLSIIGLWPESLRLHWLITCAIYYNYHLLMNYILLYKNLTNFKILLRIFVGTLTFSYAAIRLYLLYKHNKTFKYLFDKIKKDYSQDIHASVEEVGAILHYNRLAKKWIKILLTVPTLIAVLYYIRPLLIRYLMMSKIKFTLFIFYKSFNQF